MGVIGKKSKWAFDGSLIKISFMISKKVKLYTGTWWGSEELPEKVTVSMHPHPLYRVGENEGWDCNGGESNGLEGGCRSDVAHPENHDEERF
jgi:hypothetical protein